MEVALKSTTKTRELEPGLGRALAIELLDRGWEVWAVLRKAGDVPDGVSGRLGGRDDARDSSSSCVTLKKLLSDPWEFKAMIWELPLHAAYAQRLALLHLVHPDTFEPIVAREMKKRIVARFADRIMEPSDDVDRQLLQIRSALADEHGAPFNFWDKGIIEHWQPDSGLWGQIIHWGTASERTHQLGRGRDHLQARVGIDSILFRF